MLLRDVVSHQALIAAAMSGFIGPISVNCLHFVSTFPLLPMLYQEQYFEELLLSACLHKFTEGRGHAYIFSFKFPVPSSVLGT